MRALPGRRRGLHIRVRGGRHKNGAIAVIHNFMNTSRRLGTLTGLLGAGYNINNSTGRNRVVVRNSFGPGIIRLLIGRNCAGAGWLAFSSGGLQRNKYAQKYVTSKRLKYVKAQKYKTLLLKGGPLVYI